MTTAWAILLLLGLAAAAPQTQILTYEQAIALAVNLYNQQRPSQFVFRLLEAEPQPNWDPNSKTAQTLKFSVKETVCPTSQGQNLSQCDFKEDGLDKDCSGIYSAQQQPPISNIRCVDISQQLNQTTRFRFIRRLFGSIFGR